MSSKALQDMTLREFIGSVLKAQVGATNLKWVVVPTEEAKQAHIEATIEGGYECGCDDGPEKCLEDTTIVVPGTEEFMARIVEEGGERGNKMPMFLHLSVGNIAVAMAETSQMPQALMAVAYGLDPTKFDQAGLEEALAEAKEVIDNVEDFLASFDTDGQ